MSNLRFRNHSGYIAAFLATVSVCTSGGAIAADLVPTGPLFPVNQTVILDSQDHATVAMTVNGMALIVWHSREKPDGRHNIRGRFFDSDGQPMGPEFIPNEVVDGDQAVPVAATNGLDVFVIVWSEETSPNQHHIHGMLMAADGTVLAPGFRISHLPSDCRSHPDVQMNGDGDFAVVWNQLDGDTQHHWMRAYAVSGWTLTDPIRLNRVSIASSETEGLPDIDINDTGDVLATWVHGTDSGKAAIAYSFLNIHQEPTVTPKRERFVYRPENDTLQKRPSAAMNDAMIAVVAWNQNRQEDNHRREVFFRKYLSGSGWRIPVRVHGDDGLDSRRPVVALLPSGAHLVSWNAEIPGSERSDIFLKGFTLAGNAATDEILVNREMVDGDQKRPALAVATALEPMRVIVTFESDRNDGNNRDVFARLYEVVE